MGTRIEAEFDEGWMLEGSGDVVVERGQLFADGTALVQKSDLVYLRLEQGQLLQGGHWAQELVPGSYAICSGGLYERVIP